MTGLYLLFVAAVWFALGVALAYVVTSRIADVILRFVVALVVVAVLLPLPLADELIGKQKFERLCEEKSKVILDTANTQGRTVWFGGSERTQIIMGLMQLTQIKRSYVDAETQEPIYHYFRLEMSGGWLMRSLGISEGGGPLIFSGLCQPKHIDALDDQLGLTHINRPTAN